MKINIKRGERIIIGIGLFLICMGIIFNEWVIVKLFSPEGVIEFSNRVAVWTFDLFFLSFGLSLIFLRKKTNLCINILLLFSTIVLCLIGAEIFLRIFEKPDPSTINSEGEIAAVFSSEYHHDYRPSQVFTRYPSKYDEFEPIENIINNLSIRGPEIPEKEIGEYRILLLGDSFIQADEIKFEETIGEVLNRMLEEEKVKVIQHGMGSWSPLLELNWLLKKGLNLKPDLVIIFLCINDFYSSYAKSDIAYTKNTIFDSDGLPLNFKLLKKDLSSWIKPRLLELTRQFFSKNASFQQEEINYWLSVDKSILNSSLNSSIAKDVKFSNLIRDIIRLSRPVELWDEETYETVSLSLEYLYKIKKITDDDNVSLAITYIPLGWNISKEENIEGRKYYGFSDVIIPMGGIEDRIKTYSLENNIDYINIYSEFKNFTKINKEKLFLISDGHWNSQGHKVGAEIIHKYIKEKNKKE